MMCNGDGHKKAANREPLQGRPWKSSTSTLLKTAKMHTPPPSHSLNPLPKVPSGNSPYVKAKHVQLVDKDPNKAISLFWAAINAGDRVNSALKDMAIIMKQVGRAEEAVEAIKSFRHLCSADAQESLDNVLLDLYKRCGRMDEQIELLELKLKLIEDGHIFGGKRTKIARSQGKKFHLSIDQERARLLGNLAWAHLQQGNFRTAEALYRKALSIAPDKNKQCNLTICLIQTGRISEAKSLLSRIQPSTSDLDQHGPDSYMKSFERASEMLAHCESQLMQEAVETKVEEQLETDVERSSLSSTPNRSLNSMGTTHRNQNPGATICKELLKTETKSSSSSILGDIANCPDSRSGNLDEGMSRWEDGNNALELGARDYLYGNVRQVNDVDEETMYSPPLTMRSFASPVFSDQNHNHGSQILGSGGCRWRSNSGDELFVSDDKSNSYKMRNAFSTSNSANLNVEVCSWVENDAEAYSFIVNNGIEEEAFTDENLNSNLRAEFPIMECVADSTSYRRSPVQAAPTMTSEPSNKGNWKGRGLKHPPQVLSSRQSPVHGDWRWRADLVPISIKGDKGTGMSPCLLQGNSEHPQEPRISQTQSSIIEDGKSRSDDVPSSGIEGKWIDSTAEKLLFAADKNTIPCRQSEPILIGNPQVERAFQMPSSALSASSCREDSNCSSDISVSRKQVDCTSEKWSPEIQNQQPVGQKNQTDGSPGSIEGWADKSNEKDVKSLSSSVTENTKASHDFSTFNYGKTWAEMVEEEEEALAISNLNLNVVEKQTEPMPKQSASWEEKDMFPDENLDFNIMQSSPCLTAQPSAMLTPPQKHQRLLGDYADSLQWKLETDDEKEGYKTHLYSTPNNTYSGAWTKQRQNLFSAGQDQNSSVRRCLSFEPQQKQESAAGNSPASTKIFYVDDDYSYLRAIGSGSKRPRNRLRVFQEMTLSGSPRA